MKSVFLLGLTCFATAAVAAVFGLRRQLTQLDKAE